MVKTEDAQKFAEQIGVPLYETSAKENQNVEEVSSLLPTSAICMFFHCFQPALSVCFFTASSLHHLYVFFTASEPAISCMFFHCLQPAISVCFLWNGKGWFGTECFRIL